MGQQLSFFFRVSTPSWALSPRQKHHGRKFSYMRKSSTASHFDHHHNNNNNNNNHDSHNHNDSGFLLPHELAFHILEYLDMRTKFMIQQVNKSQWYHIVSYWLSLQEAFVFERIDCTTNNNNHHHSHHHSDHVSSSTTTNHASSNNNNTHQQRKTKQPHFTRISDSSFRQFVIMLDKSFNEYKQQYQIINLTEEKQSSSSSSNINNNNHHDHHDQFVQCGLYGDYYDDYYDDDNNECDEIDEYHEEENDDVNNVNNIRCDDDDDEMSDDEVSEGDVAYNILYEKSESGHSCEHIQLGVESSCQCNNHNHSSNRCNSSGGDHDEKQVRNSTIRSLTMRRKSAIQNGTDCARVNDHDDDFVRTVNNNNNNNKMQNEMTLVATHEMTDCAVKNGKNNVIPHLKSPLPRTGMTTRKQTVKEAVVHVEKKRRQQKQQKPRFKFASLKRVSLIQCQNLQNKSTLSSQFYLPMLKEWNNSTNNSGDASLQENHHCYHVGRSAVSVEFKTASSDVIGQKPDVKQRFSFGLAAHSNIGKRKVRNLSRYGNYVHYHYSPQWDTGTTTCSAYVNHAGSTLGPIETSTLCYDYDTRYCSTIFVDDTCYRVFVDSEYKNDTSVNESVEESKSLNESENGEDERMHKRLSSSSLIIPSSSWLLQNQTPYEIVRHREKEFPFRHTTDSNALCNVLDQLNVVHNKDVIELRYVSFHHIPSWVGKFRMFSEHSFSVQHRPEITCIVDRNRLFGIQDL